MLAAAWIFAGALSLVSVGASGGEAPFNPSDLRIEGATVYEAPPWKPRSLSIVVRDGRVLFVGDPARARDIAPKASVLAFPDAFIFPGWADAHGHLASLGKALETADLVGAKDAADAGRRIAAVAERLPAGAWAEGRGWDQNRWPGGAYPDARDLDAAVSGRPAVARRIDGHAMWANGAALARAGIDAMTADPPGGRILRRADGTPAGVLVDNAMELVEKAMPPTTPADFERHILAASRACARLGLTEVQDASGYVPQDVASLERLAAAGSLPIRIYATVSPRREDLDVALARGIRVGTGHDFLTVRAIKAYADGALGSRGAALLADYSDEAGNRGLLLTPPERLAETAVRAGGKGWQLWIHAIGDRGNRAALDAFAAGEAATPGGPAGRNRPRIEHAQVIALSDVARFHRENVIASIQPTHATSDMGWAEKRVGPERIKGAYAWRTLVSAGVRLAGGSDFPVESENPLQGFHAAVTRQDADGKPPGGWRRDERLTRAEALSLFTTDAAYAAFEENRRGRIAAGFDADFTVFAADPMTAPDDKILSIRTLATIVAGTLVHGDAR
jgi:predicted amidohydrolase YtcJ